MGLAEIGFCQANNNMEFKLGIKGRKVIRTVRYSDRVVEFMAFKNQYGQKKKKKSIWPKGCWIGGTRSSELGRFKVEVRAGDALD